MVVVQRVTGVAALVGAAAIALSWVANFLIIQPIIDVIGVDGFSWIFAGVFWLKGLASLAVLAGLAAGWRLSRPLWASGLIPVALGLVLQWGWWLLDRQVDLWGMSRYGVDDATGEVRPELSQLAALSTTVSLAVSVVAIALLVFGGLRVLRSPISSRDEGSDG
jgi:hypothetical protein